MTSLLLDITPQALGSMISPTVLAATMLILGGRNFARSRTAVYLAGCAAVLAGVAVLALGAATEVRPPGSTTSSPAVAAMDVALGLLLIGLAIRQAISKKPPRARKAQHDEGPPKPRLYRFFALGVLMMITNFSTLVLYISAMKEIGVSHASAGLRGVAIAYVATCSLLPILVPLLLEVVAPQASAHLLLSLNQGVQKHSRLIGIILCLVFGVYLLAKGLLKT